MKLLITCLLLCGSLHANASDIDQMHDQMRQTSMHAQKTPINKHSSSTAHQPIRTSYWYGAVDTTIIVPGIGDGEFDSTIIIPSIGGGYRAFIIHDFSLDFSLSLSHPAFIELRLLSLIYAKNGLYGGLGVGLSLAPILLLTPWWHDDHPVRSSVLGFGRIAIGYEWSNKKNKRRFIQLTGFLPKLSFGLEF